MNRIIVYMALSALIPYALVEAQSTVASRCFQFTWLGERYTNESEFMNATCSDATRMSDGVPCFQPLVVSYDGTWPDLEYIWRHYANEATCILASNDVCATYTYYFNGNVENSTYMCTRVVNMQGEAVTSGCYTQTNGSSSTRVCLCRSVPGGMPCNNAVSVFASVTAVTAAMLLMLINELTSLWWK